MYRQLVPDRPAGPDRPDPPRPERRPGAGRGQEAPLPGGARRRPPDRRRPRGLRPGAIPARRASSPAATGPIVEILAEALGGDQLAPTAEPDGRWPTFAGSPTRTKVVPGRSTSARSSGGSSSSRSTSGTRSSGMGRMRRIRMPTAPIPEDRHARLPPDRPGRPGDRLRREPDHRLQPERPARAARPARAGTIKAVWKHDEDQDGGAPQAPRLSLGVPRYTLTAFGDRIYARMGPTGHALPGVRPAGWAAACRRARSSPSTGAPTASCSGSGRRPRSPCPSVRPTRQPGTWASRGRPWPTPGASTSP